MEIPSVGISRLLRDATSFLERIDDVLPGGGKTLFKVLDHLAP